MRIDTSFDFQAEAGGRDADRYSPTLQAYHQMLWSKPLPCGITFELHTVNNHRLYHHSSLGEFYLSSDRAVANFASWKKLTPIIEQLSAEYLHDFITLTDTIGGIVLWPSTQVHGLPTINAARGFNAHIADRLDITIECIRRYYDGEQSPLYETLCRYDAFFALFDDFKGYIDFFLLQDYVSSDYRTVMIAPPFDNFETTPVPTTTEAYRRYADYTARLVRARNERIAEQSLA